MHKTPEHISGKAPILERRSPNFAINNAIDRQNEGKFTRNFEAYNINDSQTKASKRAQVVTLQEKLRELEQKLAEKDTELEKLHEQTKSIVKARDECVM